VTGEWIATVLLAALSVAAVALFVRGCRRPRSESLGRAVLLALGLASFVAALSPPGDAFADGSFAAHMAQHLVLIAVVAPLLVAADPIPSIVAGLSPGARRPVLSLHRGVRSVGWRSVHPAVGFVSHMGALVAWHAPPLFDAAVQNTSAHVLEHASFLGTALLFWTPVLTVRGRRRLGEVGVPLYLAAAGLIGSAIGALLTFSSTPLYPVYVASEGASRAVRDQQLAGLLMWIPPGVVYVAVSAVVLWRWLERSQRDEARAAPEPFVSVGLGDASSVPPPSGE
jgi:putative membrane protein